MATEVGTLLISMQADLARLRQDMSEAKGITGRAMGDITRSIDSVKNAFGLLGVGVSAGGLAMIAKQAVDTADDMAKLSQRVGIGTKELAQWKFVAELSGTSVESLGKGVKGLATYIQTHGDRLKALGIDTLDANRAMLQLADIVAELPDDMQQAALMSELFGVKVGAELIPTMNLGSKGIAELQAKAADYAKRLAELAPNAQRVNDALTEMNFQSKLLVVNISNVVAGPMASWLEANNEAVRIAGSGTEALRLFVFNLDAMTTEKPADEIRRLTQALNDYAAAQTGLERFAQSPIGALFGGREADLQKQIAFLKFLQRQQAMDGAANLGDYRDARDLRISANYGAAARAANADRAAKLLLGGVKSTKPAKFQQSPDFLAWVQAQRAGESGLSAREVMAQLHADDAAQAQEADLLDKLRAKYVDLADPLQKYRDQLDEINRLRADNLLTTDQALNAEWAVGEAMDEAAQKMMGLKEKGEDAFSDLTRAVDAWGNKAADTFAEFVTTGKASFSDLVRSMLFDIARLQAKKALDPITAAAGNLLNGALGNLFGGSVGASVGGQGFGSAGDAGTLLGFAGGGDFTVSGSGGTDSQLVAFRATPGERVSVRTPAQAAGGGQVFHFAIDARGADPTVPTRIEQAVQRAVRLSVAAVASTASRGGYYAKAVGRA